MLNNVIGKLKEVCLEVNHKLEINKTMQSLPSLVSYVQPLKHDYSTVLFLFVNSCPRIENSLKSSV